MTKPLAERFWAKVEKAGADECWTWTAAVGRNGYGKIGSGGSGGRTLSAHRVSYELAYGEIPDGLAIDHACHNRVCVNPAHLRAVTPRLNQQNRSGARSDTKSGVRGVGWFKAGGKWRVRATYAGRRYSGGYFDDLAEAERAAIDLRNRLMTNNLLDKAVA